MKLNLVKILNIFLVAVLAFFVFLPAAVMADTGVDSALGGLNKAAVGGFGKGDGNNPATITSIPKAIGKIIGAALSFVGVLFLILIIYGGFTWMTARGNEQEVEKAKDLIIAAVIGLIIILSAYAITSYLGGTLTLSS